MKDLHEKLEEYTHTKSQLDKFKAKEMKLRLELASHYLHGKKVGTHNFNDEFAKVKAVKKVTTSLDADQLSALFDDFTNEERECITFKPQLIMKEYKLLSEDERDLLDMCIVVKPATPAFSVKLFEEE